MFSGCEGPGGGREALVRVAPIAGLIEVLIASCVSVPPHFKMVVVAL